MGMARTQLIEQLIHEGYLFTPRIVEAFTHIKRGDFIPPSLRENADTNVPLSIGWGQTISQPLTVAFMLELLRPEPGSIVLDIGYGSGWTTALLAHIVSEEGRVGSGKVFAIERIPELAEFGKKNVAKYNFLEKGIAEMICGDGTKGWEEHAPFDCIHAAASARNIPQPWKDQLRIGGRLVLPVENSIWLLIKKSQDGFEEHEYPGFAFVPLIEG